MIGKRHLLLAVSLLASTPLSAAAQGTYTNGVRSGYAGTTTSSSSSSTATSTGSSAGTASSSIQSSRNLGTGQGRTEGAMGLSPQLQKEMGISRQQ
ncbi:hypothetical protein [Bradyrhizobium commune]|uniref:Uncharacterized protein n=1 Tax=Bradyrhizobium commune TaxID=83627 RepID=A0A7S9GYX6_9BRAD|nr:hypothetical protein [Bradyrhizobium commune]QPF90301.1 hypothetical protein IC761_27950 [Bradyrhizobium commune]